MCLCLYCPSSSVNQNVDPAGTYSKLTQIKNTSGFAWEKTVFYFFLLDDDTTNCMAFSA